MSEALQTIDDVLGKPYFRVAVQMGNGFVFQTENLRQFEARKLKEEWDAKKKTGDDITLCDATIDSHFVASIFIITNEPPPENPGINLLFHQ